LGNGTSTNSSIPIQVGQVEIDDDWQSVFGGYWRTLALKTDGTLWAWGKNSSGQLGNGTYTNSNVPIQVGADNDWQIIANGTSHTLALKTNGILWAWGDNIYGQLGNGTTVSSNIPIQIE